MDGSGVKIFFDGGCRPNPGEMEVAAVAGGRLFHQPAQGQGSSHHAEWLALLHALRIGRALGETDIVLLGDARAVVEQANGRSRCKSPELRDCLTAFQAEAGRFARIRVRHIKRSQNLAGIALAKIGEGVQAGPALFPPDVAKG